ncbi:hypothetical protein LEL_09726 [Akanthomyces lecanii RCEF 1005]|uniref:Uncharacterized protein n=1 Tax=Akanthomyces lecanii RCEF 1005 TaxID=1081108 RepID=A0A168BBY7_CORDF|nr:hypothetical protein LEL_09726 [Akanthomyces lecanii RCEF 1005]
MQRGNDYVDQAGEVYGHNVVIAKLPACQEYGTGSAAALASQGKKSFPNIWFGLLVGLAASLPALTGPSPRDIRLGDTASGLIVYDLGKETVFDCFQLLRGGHVLAVTEPVVRAAIGSNKRIQTDSTGPTRREDRRFRDGSLDRTNERRTRIWYDPASKLVTRAGRTSKFNGLEFGIIFARENSQCLERFSSLGRQILPMMRWSDLARRSVMMLSQRPTKKSSIPNLWTF